MLKLRRSILAKDNLEKGLFSLPYLYFYRGKVENSADLLEKISIRENIEIISTLSLIRWFVFDDKQDACGAIWQ